MDPDKIVNPFRPGAGQQPVYLAGRTQEQENFGKLLEQRPVMRNLVLTGLRGVGKTVLLDEFKPIAQKAGWLWTGNYVSESATHSEDRLASRLITDLSVLLAPILIKQSEELPFGFNDRIRKKEVPVSFNDLWNVYEQTPGLTDDKIKAVLRMIQNMLAGTNVKGIVFAYDEAQNLKDRADDNQYPLSILLDVFASLQRGSHNIQVMLVLTGLPTLFAKLTEARTYSERMFDVMQLEKLDEQESRDAIEIPIKKTRSPLTFSEETTRQILAMSGGYPYFLQYIGKEVFDAWIGKMRAGEAVSVPRHEIIAKLDQDFYAPRWEKITDRQQEFMQMIALLDNSSDEFSGKEIVAISKTMLPKGFSASHTTQMLGTLTDRGFIYRNRYGKYCFAVPLLNEFIRRQSLPRFPTKP